MEPPFGTTFSAMKSKWEEQKRRKDSPISHRYTQSFKSQFTEGMALTLEVRPSKVIETNRVNKSQIKFEPLTREEKAAYSNQKEFKPRSISPFSEHGRG